MVRALLAGTKTQTRRAVTRLAGFGPVREFQASDTRGYQWQFRDREMRWNDIQHERLMGLCPYGQPGDQLWVKETFNHFERNDTLKPGDKIYYRADGDCVDLQPWRPNIHMPHWASRLTLEITGVRVEQLQDINEADAIAEGCEAQPCDHTRRSCEDIGCCGPTAAGAYRALWDQINGDGAWDTNPWVWVVEFKRAGESVHG